MKLRSKILLALIFVGVTPLVISLWVIGGMVSDGLETQTQARTQQVADFIQKTITRTSAENLTLVQLMASNPLMVNAVYSADFSGDDDQLTSMFTDMDALPFDQIQVLGKEGKQLFRVFKTGSKEIPATSGVEHPVIEASLEGEAYAENGLFDGVLAITAAAPVSMYGEPIGHLVGVSYLDKRLAAGLKSLGHVEVGFFDDSGIYVSTTPDLASSTCPPFSNHKTTRRTSVVSNTGFSTIRSPG